MSGIFRGRTNECIMCAKSSTTPAQKWQMDIADAGRPMRGSTFLHTLNLKLWGSLYLHTLLQLLSGCFWVFFLPLNIDNLDVLTCSCWVFCHMSCFLRHTFPVIPPDKFYSVTWCVWASECVCGHVTRSITLQMKSNEACSYTGRSSDCIGFKPLK